MKKKFSVVALAIVATVFIVSCKKEETKNSISKDASSNNISKNSDYFVKNGIMHFKDNTSFESYLEKLKISDTKNNSDYSSSITFYSMKKCFNDIVNEESKISEEHEKRGNNEYSKVEHGNLISKFPNVCIIKTLEDGGKYFEINVNNNDYFLANVLNPDGIVIVGENIYQYTDEYTKIMKGVDYNKINQLIKTNTSNNEITVSKNKEMKADWVTNCQGNNDGFRIITYMGLTQTVSGRYTYTTFKITVRSLRRRVGGAWYDNHAADISGRGSFTGSAASYGTTPYWFSSIYGATHTWEHYILNNYKTSYNHPQVSTATCWAQASSRKTVSCTVNK